MRIPLIAASLLLSGCIFESWQTMTLADEGTFCLEGNADETIDILVDAQVCLSSSCSRNASGSCSAAIDNDIITITSSFEWEEASGNVACTDDCGFLGAECEIGPLPAGTYTVMMGDTTETIDIPTTGDCSAF